MNEPNAMTKSASQPKAIESAIESIMKTQSAIHELLSAGEQHMDNVCRREPEESEPDVKDSSPSNITEALQKIEKYNGKLVTKAEHLIRRMRDTF